MAGYVRWFSILLAKFLLIPSSVAQTVSCCESFHPSTYYDELSVSSDFSTYSVGSLEWKLMVNVTWSPPPDSVYEGYDVEFVLEGIYVCDRQCESENLLMRNWRVFDGLQFGSVYHIKMYVSKSADDNKRGPSLTGISCSPDCYDETESIEFCMTQAVGYIGKPFNITTDIERIDGTNDVTVYVTWRQPIHINPDTPLNYYMIGWNSVDVGSDSMKLLNITYEPAELLTTKLATPLQDNTNYTLTITPIVLDLNTNMNKFKSEAEVSFNTYLPDEMEDVDSNIFPISYLFGIAVGLFLLVVAIGCVIYKTKVKEKEHREFMPVEPRPDVQNVLSDYPQYEIPRDDITWDERIKLGSGHYGEVYKCKIQTMEESVVAAVKVPRQMAISKELEDFLEEIKQIIKLGKHENIVRFLGYSTSSNPLMMINEFIQYGDMYNFMRNIKNKRAPDDPIYKIELINQLEISKQIAAGMAYISSKRLLHGDLAARNILIDEGLRVKITDFGLSQDIYERNYYRMESHKDFPWRWQAIEAFTERKVSSKSDVWSFGVVLSEIFKFCDPPPYHNILARDELVTFLKAGKRMERPVECPKYMYRIMMRCWDVSPLRRPTFNDLFDELEQQQVDLHNRSNIESGAVGNKPQRSQALTDTSGSSCGGMEFIREPGSEESGTDSNDKSKETRQLISPHRDLRQNSYVNQGFVASSPIDNVELRAHVWGGDRIDSSGSNIGYPASNEEQDEGSVEKCDSNQPMEMERVFQINKSLENDRIDLLPNEITENGCAKASLEISKIEENLDRPQPIGTDNFGHEDIGSSGLNKKDTTGSCTTSGESCVSGEFIRESDSGVINELDEEQRKSMTNNSLEPIRVDHSCHVTTDDVNVTMPGESSGTSGISIGSVEFIRQDDALSV